VVPQTSSGTTCLCGKIFDDKGIHALTCNRLFQQSIHQYCSPLRSSWVATVSQLLFRNHNCPVTMAPLLALWVSVGTFSLRLNITHYQGFTSNVEWLQICPSLLTLLSRARLRATGRVGCLTATLTMSAHVIEQNIASTPPTIHPRDSFSYPSSPPL
jgi:hypothetical protein